MAGVECPTTAACSTMKRNKVRAIAEVGRRCERSRPAADHPATPPPDKGWTC